MIGTAGQIPYIKTAQTKGMKRKMVEGCINTQELSSLVFCGNILPFDHHVDKNKQTENTNVIR